MALGFTVGVLGGLGPQDSGNFFLGLVRVLGIGEGLGVTSHASLGVQTSRDP